MAKVLLLGASGLVGGELLRLLRLDARVTSIIAPSRKPLPVMNKLINPQGENIGELLKTLDQPVDLVFCCLGTTRKQAGSQAAFRLVDYRLVLAAGETGLRLGARHFLLVSAMGLMLTHGCFITAPKVRPSVTYRLRAGHNLLLPGPQCWLVSATSPA